MRAEEIAREYSGLLECGSEGSCRKFKFAQMREEEIVGENPYLLECGMEKSRTKIRICSNVEVRDHEITIRSNARGRDRVRRLQFARILGEKSCARFEFARMREGEIAREHSSLLECGSERSYRIFDFARMQEKEIAREYSNLLEFGRRNRAGNSNALECEMKRSHTKIRICLNAGGRDRV